MSENKSYLDLPKDGIVNSVLRKLVPNTIKTKETKIVILGCGVKAHFPWEETCNRYNKAYEQIKKDLDLNLFNLVRSDQPFEDADLMMDFLNNEGSVDGVILFHASFTDGEIGAVLGRYLSIKKIPLLSWSFPDEKGERLSANSMCCQNFILGIFNTLKVKYVWFQKSVDEELHPYVNSFFNSVRALSRFKTAKVLSLGGSRVPGFYDCEIDELDVLKRFGLRVDRTDIEVIFSRAKKFSDTQLKELKDALIESEKCSFNDVSDEQIFQTLRLALGTLDLAAEKNYIGCSVKSWPEMFDIYGCASDGAVSLLNDMGLCTTEEGDMNGLISSLALYFISEGNAIPTMLDISIADTKLNRLGVWHCGSSATRLLKEGTTFEAHRHSILENNDSESAVGLMIEFLLELGDVTMLRYQYPQSGKMYGWQGSLEECKAGFRGTYGELKPSGNLSVDTIMGTIFDNGLDHHWSLGYGHWLEDINMMNHFLDIEKIEHSNIGGMRGFSRW